MTKYVYSIFFINSKNGYIYYLKLKILSGEKARQYPFILFIFQKTKVINGEATFHKFKRRNLDGYLVVLSSRVDGIILHKYCLCYITCRLCACVCVFLFVLLGGRAAKGKILAGLKTELTFKASQLDTSCTLGSLPRTLLSAFDYVLHVPGGHVFLSLAVLSWMSLSLVPTACV